MIVIRLKKQDVNSADTDNNREESKEWTMMSFSSWIMFISHVTNGNF